MSNSTYIEEEECRECKALPQKERKEVTKDDFKYNIGDVLTVQPPTIGISSPARPDILYKEHLRVVFRFWDGGAHVYVVETEDGIGMFMMEQDAALESHAPAPEPQPEQPKGYTEEQVNDLQEAWKESLEKRDKKIDELQREVFDKTRRLKEIDDLGEVNTRTAIACLDSVEAMLRHSLHGATHRMRNFYTDAMLEYMDKVRADIKMPKSNDENPF